MANRQAASRRASDQANENVSEQITEIAESENEKERAGDTRYKLEKTERRKKLRRKETTVAADEDAGDLGTLCQALSSSCDHITFL